ncbi:MAG: hypothetical protein ACM3IH_08915 [Sphingobacteriales bacterium]
MRFGLPWRVKGIRHEARETAEAAARRAGLPLNEWLNTVILQQAAGQDFKPNAPVHARRDDRADDFSRAQLRLDDLTRRIEQVARTGPAAYAPKRTRQDADRIAEQVERLEQRLHEVASRWPEPAAQSVQLPPVLDRAVAEFTSRRRALNGEETLATMRDPASTQRFAGLEGQLQRITEQIETLKRPGVEEAIKALRAELGEIGRTLNAALPRHSIESLEMQIQVLTQRIAEGREAGVDGGTIAGIENGIAEVRDALWGLMPAENLIGYNEAIKALTQKIDLIVADKNPAAMQQLERSLMTLREMSAHVASNDAVSRLSAQVQTLADKIDRLATGARSDGPLDNLEGRIDALTRALADRAQIESTAPLRLETLIQTLSAKIAELQKAGGDSTAANNLEERIVKLMERLEASDSRLNKLDAIERGLADLLVHIEDLRANRPSSAIRAEGPGIDLLRQDIAQTQDTLEAVHGRLGHLFDRLAVIEKGIHGGETPRSESQRGDNFEFAEPPSARAVEPVIGASEPAPAQALEPIQASEPMPPADLAMRDLAPLLAVATPPSGSRSAEPAPIVSGLLEDQPLEPGSGPPRRAISPSLRIAASEAALGRPRANTPAAASKSDFIAAARRAAQAAGQDPGRRASRPEARKPVDGERPAPRSKVAKRVKAMLLAASIVAIIIVGSIQLLGNVFDFSIFDTNDNKFAASSGPGTASSDIAAPDTESATVAANPRIEPASLSAESTSPPAETHAVDVAAGLLSPQALPSLTPAPVIGARPASPSAPGLSEAMPSLLAPPALNAPAPSSPSGDVTGSVAHAPGVAPKRQAAPPQQPLAADRLPAGIAGPRLRNAALGGDAGAAYEVAMRFVEGRGVAANLEEAARWFERAASKGLTPAQFRYASMLEKGQGVKKDLAAAQKLYIAAAGKGHAKAMHNLAVLYAEGADGKPDYSSAAQWFRKAAEHGVADSQYNLGVLTARGLGTERNIAEAYKWFALAAAQGDKDAARKRDEVAAHLDAQALVAAQQAVKNFAPATQPTDATGAAAPSGGWDQTTHPAQQKQRAAGPLSISAFSSGKL